MVYLPGDIVLITAIGVSGTDADSSLMCVTSNVNTQCCRGSDGGNVGEWYFPSGTKVPRQKSAPSADFTRSGSTHQVRLNRRNSAMSPTGIYECRVPDSGAANASAVTAQITVGEAKNNNYMGRGGGRGGGGGGGGANSAPSPNSRPITIGTAMALPH